MHMNSSGYVASLAVSSWKIWLWAVMKTKQILAVIRRLRERIIHTSKSVSQGSYKTVINPVNCSQITERQLKQGAPQARDQAGKNRHGRRQSWRTQTIRSQAAPKATVESWTLIFDIPDWVSYCKWLPLQDLLHLPASYGRNFTFWVRKRL